MKKGQMIENIKFLIKQYEKELENANKFPADISIGEVETYTNIIIELKFILELEGIKYEES